MKTPFEGWTLERQIKNIFTDNNGNYCARGWIRKEFFSDSEIFFGPDTVNEWDAAFEVAAFERAAAERVVPKLKEKFPELADKIDERLNIVATMATFNNLGVPAEVFASLDQEALDEIEAAKSVQVHDEVLVNLISKENKTCKTF